MTQTMTKGEWVEASFNMAWCIYNNEDITAYRNGLKTDEDPLLTWQKLRLDFSAPAGTPDGVHKVQHQSKLGIGHAEGVVVKDGLFVPEPTQRAVFEAVCMSCRLDPETASLNDLHRLGHYLIEDFKWDDQHHVLEVSTSF